MTTRLIALTLSALALTCGAAAAQNLDAASQEALGAVLKMLQDPASRAGAIAGSPQGGAADRQMRDLAGNNPAVTQELYELAAQVFEDVTRGSGGDVKAMSQAFSRGQSDPAGFASMLSPRTLERLRALSIKISDQQRR
ncbi:MAG TPA: hypothetical protein VGT02_04440 [Methylomirabilota bacterium]|nr:hypothetical protein [Methylomirabilota bacterium]